MYIYIHVCCTHMYASTWYITHLFFICVLSTVTEMLVNVLNLKGDEDDDDMDLEDQDEDKQGTPTCVCLVVYTSAATDIRIIWNSFWTLTIFWSRYLFNVCAYIATDLMVNQWPRAGGRAVYGNTCFRDSECAERKEVC